MHTNTKRTRVRPNSFYLWKLGSPVHRDLTGFGITGAPSVDARYWFEKANPIEMRRLEVLFLKLGEKDARRLEKELKAFADGNVEYLRLPQSEVIGMVRSLIATHMPRHLKQFEEARS